MSNVQAPSADALAKTISARLYAPGEDEIAGGVIAGHVENLEDQLLKLYANPEKDEKGNITKFQEAKIEELQIRYKRTVRVYESFQTLMKNAHELMMRAIQNLRIN